MESEGKKQNESLKQDETLPDELKEAKISSGKKRSTLIFACSGLSNTGKLTMQAASTLAFRRPDIYRAAAALKGTDTVEDALSEGFRVLALNGCEDRCATKNLERQGYRQKFILWLPR